MKVNNCRLLHKKYKKKPKGFYSFFIHFVPSTESSIFIFIFFNLSLILSALSKSFNFLAASLSWIKSKIIFFSLLVTKLLSSLFFFKFIPSSWKHFANDKIIFLSSFFGSFTLSKSLFNDAPFISLILRPGLNKHLSLFLDEQRSSRFLDKVI